MDEQFHAERHSCIGGSDIKHLFSLEPYGCARRLFYDKAGVTPDYEHKPNAFMRRGLRLEEVVVEEFERETGLKCKKVEHTRHHAFPHFGVHADRLIDDGSGQWCGVLECKVPGLHVFQNVKSNGQPLDWQLQLQWALDILGRAWGYIAVFHADSWRLLAERQEYDPDLALIMRSKAREFWELVERARADLGVVDLPDQLDQADARCQACPWRGTCQGRSPIPELSGQELAPDSEIDLDPSLQPLFYEYLAAKQAAKEADVYVSAVKARIVDALAGRTAVDCAAGKILHRDHRVKEYTVPAQTRRALIVIPHRQERNDDVGF